MAIKGTAVWARVQGWPDFSALEVVTCLKTVQHSMPPVLTQHLPLKGTLPLKKDISQCKQKIVFQITAKLN